MPEPLNLDELFGGDDEPQVNPVVPQPVSPPVVDPPDIQTTAQRPTKESNFGSWFGFALAIFFAALWLSTFSSCRFNPIPDDGDDTPIVRVDKPTVLLAWDDNGQTTEGQDGVINTTKVQTWCEQNGIDYRRFDVDDDLTRTEPKWQGLMEASSDPPSITVATDKRTRTFDLPDTVDETINTIREEVK